jgi:methyl-accepting chemotaxis protein
VGQARATMGEMIESVRRVGDVMDDIASARAEQEAGIEQVNRAISKMDAAPQQNAACSRRPRRPRRRSKTRRPRSARPSASSSSPGSRKARPARTRPRGRQ